MKNLNHSILACSLLLLCSCGVDQALVLNHNQNTTQVQLTQNNYHYVGRAIGSDSVSYVLVFGGARQKRLYNNAYAAMMENAQLGSGSRAVVNIVTEEHIGGVPPFCYKRTITISGNVIEFTR